MLTEKKAVSSDRLLRCESIWRKPETPLCSVLGSVFKKRTKEVFQKDNSESDTDTETEVAVENEFEGESFSDDTESPSDALNENEFKIKLEHYYAVIYDIYYIGRVLEINEETCVVKFLKLNVNQYNSPKNEDIQTVHKQLCFMDLFIW